MKNALLRITSALIIASLMLSVTSCNNAAPKKSGKVIATDSPWYDATIIDVNTGVDANKNVSLFNHYYVGSDENYYIILTTGEYEKPPDDEIDWETFNYKDYIFGFIAVVDRNTNQTVNTIDVQKDLTINESWIDDAYFKDGKLTVKTDSTERDYDPATGELLDTRSGQGDELIAFTNTYNVGDYKIETVSYQPETGRAYVDICIVSPDGSNRTVEIKKTDKNTYISTVLTLSNTQALVPAYIGNENIIYELDLTNGELTIADEKDYDWLNIDDLYSSFTGVDGMLYCKTESGVSRINVQNKSIEEIFNYNWCNLNRGFLQGTGICHVDFNNIIECSDNRIVLLVRYTASDIYSGQHADSVNLIIFEKNETNPNAGKTVLELYARNGINEQAGEAISRFNMTNDLYFIEVIDRYQEESIMIDINNVDTEVLSALDSGTELSNQLAIDIMNGEGPDILLDVSEFSQLNSPNCLADLTPYLEDLDSEEYYTNVIDGSKTGDAIYQLPVSFKIEGIMTKAKYAGASGMGFTLDEYSGFVNDVMNGSDPLLYGQATYFSMLFNEMNGYFISDGKVDLSVPEYEMLADYVRDNVQEEGIGWNQWYEKYNGYLPSATNCVCYGIGSYLNVIGGVIHSSDSKMSILGYPSLEGTGPMFSPICSVAVSSQADDIKACAEFVNILLSEDIQTQIAMNDCFVLNRTAFLNAGSCAIEYYNNGGVIRYNGSGMGFVFGRKYEEQDIYDNENIIKSCSRIKCNDPAISKILIEEMPAYFLGQKDLDAVVSIAQDRIQTVLDER
ncbi:MAG: hypothetical protein IKQ81_09025 [Clostridiales bacterium]|nr:hypothetical protein [Clostridiales bacterium]